MATRKSTRSGGQKTPPRRGNEIRTHPSKIRKQTLREEGLPAGLRKTLRDDALKPLALDQIRMYLVVQALTLATYLECKAPFKARKARAARHHLFAAIDSIAAAIKHLTAFARSAEKPTAFSHTNPGRGQV